MGGKKQKRKQLDPERAARIRSMLEKERQLRDSLEHGFKSGKELSDRLHYDKVFKDSLARAQALLAEIKKLIEEDRLKMLEQCFLPNYELRRECERLEAELNKRRGGPPPPDPLRDAEALLTHLPADQAAAVRFVLALDQKRPPAPETTDAFEKASAFVDRFEAKVTDLRREMTLLYEVMEEGVRRKWVSRADVDGRRSPLDGFLALIDKAVPETRRIRNSSLAEYESLVQRRHELRQALDGLASP